MWISMTIFLAGCIYVPCQGGSPAPINFRAAYLPDQRIIKVRWENPVTYNYYGYKLEIANGKTNEVKDAIPENSYSYSSPRINTIYTFKLRGYDKNGWSEYTDEVHVNTRLPPQLHIADGKSGVLTLNGTNDTSNIWDVTFKNVPILDIIYDRVVERNLSRQITHRITNDGRHIELHFNGVTIDNAGIYRSVQRNGNIVLDTKVIVVSVKPSTATIHSSSPTVQGLPATLTCTSRSMSKPEFIEFMFSYHWKVNGTTIANTGKYSINYRQLRISPLDFSDRTNIYSCAATEENGLTSDPGYYSFDLQYGPQRVITSVTTKIVVVEGSSIAPINCEAECNPACSIQWKRKLNNGFAVASHTSVLTIQHVRKEQDGRYRCVATSELKINETLKKKKSEDITIDVKYGPSITKVTYYVGLHSVRKEQIYDKGSARLRENENLFLTVITDADPSANVLLINELNVTERSGVGSLNVSFDQIQCEETGYYSFTATNRYNENRPVRRQFQILVNCKPRRHNDNSQTEFGGKCNETVTFSAMIISYPKPTAKWNHSVHTDTVTKINEFTYRISGSVDITGEQDYGVYVASVSNEEGDFNMEFVVRPEDGPSITIAMYNINSGRNTILKELSSVRVTENDNLFLTVITDANPPADVLLQNQRDETESHDIGSLGVTLNRIQCQQTGNYSLKAANNFNQNVPAKRNFRIEVNCKPRRHGQNFQTDFVGKRNETIIFSAVVVSYPTPTVTWSKKLETNSNIKINEYTYRITGSVDITGEKDYGVYAATVENEEGEINIKFAIRPEGKPDNPTNFSALDILQTSVKLTWISRFDGGSKQTFSIDNEDQSRPKIWKEINHEIPDFGQNKVCFFGIQDLIPGTLYRFRLFSTNKYGDSEKIHLSVTTQITDEQENRYRETDHFGFKIGFIITTAMLVVFVIAASVTIIVLCKRRGGRESGDKMDTDDHQYHIPLDVQDTQHPKEVRATRRKEHEKTVNQEDVVESRNIYDDVIQEEAGSPDENESTLNEYQSLNQNTRDPKHIYDSTQGETGNRRETNEYQNTKLK